jgi:hypothetical protein
MSMGFSMQMHVSSSKVSKCTCYAMHTRKVTFVLIKKVVRIGLITIGIKFLDKFDTHYRTLI